MANISLVFHEISGWWLLFCLGLGLAYAWILYSKVKSLSNAWKYALFAVRTLIVGFLCLLFLSPLLKQTSSTVQPAIIVIAQDNSSSILLDAKREELYRRQLPQWTEKLADKLSEKFKVERYRFGSNTKKGFAFDFSEKQSDISEFIEGIKSRYTGSNLGAIILMSDGVYNQGSNPLYSIKGLKSPVYTIALGDTTQKRDILLADIVHEKIVFLKNDFQIGITVLAHGFEQKNSQLNVYQNGEIVFSKVINIGSSNFRTEIIANLPARQRGIQKYEISLIPLKGEITEKNNRAVIFVDVIDNRQKVILLANSPHPDLGAIKKSLNGFPNYQLETVLIDQFDVSQLSDCDLVILHQLPSDRHDLSSLWHEIIRKKIPYWFILGNQTDVERFTKMGLPLSIDKFVAQANELPSQFNPSFHLFRVKEEYKTVFVQLPPLLTVQGNLLFDGAINILFAQSKTDIVGSKPVFFFSVSKGIKSAWLMGEGLWKWRLVNGRLKGNNAAVDELIERTVQYLSSANNKRRFTVDMPKAVFYENEEISFTAQLFNKSYEPIIDAEIELTIKDGQNKSYPFVFSKSDLFYQLNAGAFPPGNYTYVAHTAEEGINEVKGSFMVDELLLEEMETKANHQILYAVAQNSGGKMLYPDEIGKLYDLIAQKAEITSISHQESSYKALISFKWLFFALISLLFVEWMVRKRNGLI